MRRILAAGALVFISTGLLSAQQVPAWDARGVGPLPRMGITSLDVSDDGKAIAVGTIAAFGDPNVIVLNDAGKIVTMYKVGQQWINQVAFLPGSHELLATCTMPAGKAGDRTEAFHLKPAGEPSEPAGSATPLKLNQSLPWFFHYGNHSNHPTMLLARAKNATALLAGNQLIIYRKDKTSTLRIPVSDPDATLSVAVDEHGWAVVGATTHETSPDQASPDRKGVGANLFLFDPDQPKPVWIRKANTEVEKAPALEKGLYGTPTLPDGTRAELPQHDEKVYAPLSVAIYGKPAPVRGRSKRLIAVADYQGWQRWVRSSATMKDDNQGLRFMPTKPTVTVYDTAGGAVQRWASEKFTTPFWCDMRFDFGGQDLVLWTHHWKCRGLGGRPILPVDDHANSAYWLTVLGGASKQKNIGAILSDTAVKRGFFRYSSWTEDGFASLVSFSPDGSREIFANGNGIVDVEVIPEKKALHIDLNKLVPKSLKPWVANARATPIVPGVWQLPGGRVESDLGGQRLIEGTDGYVLIEGHAGLSFEREWESIKAVGLDPMKVKYVLATHEHGDHAPGAYLWRVVTGAKFVCSEEMAYTLQHHIPGNTGYGLHPPIPTDIVIKNDQELDLAGLKVKAIRIPGHTAGSMAWHFEMASRERKRPEKRPETFVAFGDLIMPKGVLGYSGSVNFSATDALASLRKLHALKPDYVLPGHGAVEGPANYFQAGIDVGSKVGWGFIRPERPDPRFRITKKNVIVVGWGQKATSAAFGDIDGDGKPDVVMVTPDGEGSIVKIFLNHGGKFNEKPDQEIKVAVSQPHKIRFASTKEGPYIFVAGKTSAILAPGESDDVKAKMPSFSVIPADLSDGNHLRFLDGDLPLVSRRFGGSYTFALGKPRMASKKFSPEIDGPYVDFRMVGKDLLTSYGQLYRRGADGKFPKAPTLQLPIEKDWNFLAVGDFNGDGKHDAAFLSYGMNKATTARIFYGRDKLFGEKHDSEIVLSDLLSQFKKGKVGATLVRDNPVVADWNGDGIDDLIVAHGQHDEVLILLGGKDGLSKDRVVRIPLEYRVHYEHGVYVGDFNGDGKKDLAVFGYTNTGVGAGGPLAVYIWLQE